MLFFTADTHLDHRNIIRYCDRPFSCKEEMNERIVTNWNAKVSENDTVYHLGDFSFSDPRQFVQRLNGKIILIRGNHDYARNISGAGFHGVHDLYTLHLGPNRPSIVLCHYAMRTWPSAHYGTWHLYGHSHGTLPGIGLSFDVGVDCWNFTPVSLDEVTRTMESRQGNNLEVR